MPSLDTYFLEVIAHALPQVATKSSFRGKKCRNLAFLGYFSEECNQKGSAAFFDDKNGGAQPKRRKCLQ